eukprot:554283_1
MTWTLSNTPIHALQYKRSAFVGYYNNTMKILGGDGFQHAIVEFHLDVECNTSTTTSITFGYQHGQSSIQIDEQLWMLPDFKQHFNVYDLVQKNIIKTVPFPGNAIYGTCVTSNNEYIFIIGGSDGTGGSRVKEFHIYNRNTTTWSIGTSLNNG